MGRPHARPGRRRPPLHCGAPGSSLGPGPTSVPPDHAPAATWTPPPPHTHTSSLHHTLGVAGLTSFETPDHVGKPPGSKTILLCFVTSDGGWGWAHPVRKPRPYTSNSRGTSDHIIASQRIQIPPHTHTQHSDGPQTTPQNTHRTQTICQCPERAHHRLTLWGTLGNQIVFHSHSEKKLGPTPTMSFLHQGPSFPCPLGGIVDDG